MDFKEELESGIFSEVAPTGSNYICDPPVTDTDIDYAVLVDDIHKAESYLSGQGWAYGGSAGDDDRFASYKKDNINVILMTDPLYYNRFLAATEIAKKLNLLKKEDRIYLFGVIADIELRIRGGNTETYGSPEIDPPEFPPPTITNSQRVRPVRRTATIRGSGTDAVSAEVWGHYTTAAPTSWGAYYAPPRVQGQASSEYYVIDEVV
jgi:hypothetical protein